MNQPPSSEHAVTGHPQEAVPPGEGGSRSNRLKYSVAALLLIAVIAAILAFQLLPGRHEAEEAPAIPAPGDARALGEVSTAVYPADLLWQMPLSAGMPADSAIIDGRIFVLDTNNGGILEVDGVGRVIQTLDEAIDSHLALQSPMAIAAHEGNLYVANSLAGNVVVVDPDGAVQEVIAPDVEPADAPLRPIGVVVADNGDIFLSDPDNHRVLHLDESGKQISILGTGTRDSGEYGFNTPGGLALDAQGNLYVVDMLNYTVKKYSPSGDFLLSVGEAGDTEGTFSRPKTVAIDDGGRIFVTDTLQVAVQVFHPDGTYAGFIGRQDPDDLESGSIFQAPHGMKIIDGDLYVTDRFAGLVALHLPN